MKKEISHHNVNILEVDRIINRFGSKVLHDGVSFQVKRGEIIGIVGSSGSGKSVLLKTILGLHKPNEGQIKINEKTIGRITSSESAALFGVLFQNGALFSSMTVNKNIMLPMAEHTKLSEKERAMVAQLKLQLVGLSSESGEKYPSQLSGGMVKRASLARALALDPEILFLDEPTAGLDPIAAHEFDELIKKLNKILAITIVMITHDLDTLFSVCDRAIVLIDKKVIIDTLPNLLKHKHPWIQEYFNGPRGRAAILK